MASWIRRKWGPSWTLATYFAVSSQNSQDWSHCWTRNYWKSGLAVWRQYYSRERRSGKSEKISDKYADTGSLTCNCLMHSRHWRLQLRRRVCPIAKKVKETPSPIGFWSRRLTMPEKKLAPTYKKYLAVICVVFSLRPYFKVGHSVMRAKRKFLKWLLMWADSSGQLVWRRSQLLEIYFEVVHRARIKHQARDALSSFKIKGTDKSSLAEELPVLTIDEIEEQHDVERK